MWMSECVSVCVCLCLCRGFTVTAVAQLCVLGGMWVFGCFMFKSVAMAYLFTIFNSLQGALIFIMHCLMTKPVSQTLTHT